MRSAVAVLAVLLAVLAAPAARAQPVSEPSGPDTYLEFQLGAFFPGGPDLYELEPGLALAGTFGAKFGKHLGAEATVGYYHASGNVLATPVSDPASFNVVPVLASLRLVAPLDALELSARAGAGVHFVSSTGGPSGYQSATGFGWHAGAAAAFKLSPTMLVGVDALGTFASAKLGGVDVALEGLQVSVTLGYRL